MMECPVCGAPATDVTMAGADGRSLRCSGRCGEYVIAADAEATLAEYDREGRQAALDKARACHTSGGQPVIDGRCFIRAPHEVSN